MMNTQGKRLRKIRCALKLSQEEIGAKLKMSHELYSNIEDDLSLLHNDKLTALCRDYDVNINYLLTGSGAMFNNRINHDEDLILKVCDVLKKEGIIR